MPTLTNGLAWVPAPVPGTVDRYSVEPRESFEAADWRYRLSLDYDSACTVAMMLDEVNRDEEIERAYQERDDALYQRDDFEFKLADAQEELDDLKQEAETLRDERDRLLAAVLDARALLASAAQD